MAEYSLDNAWRHARERLSTLEAWADPGTFRHLDDLGVANGWRCLEVGAGGGSVARWLSDRVGPDGHVVATDIDTRFLDGLTAANVETRRLELGRDQLPDDGFDLVHTRAVLMHVANRRRALADLAAALRPGGWLLVEDGDFTTLGPGGSDDPEADALFARFWRAVDGVRRAAGMDPDYGRRLYGDVLRLGLEEAGAVGRLNMVRGGGPEARFWQLTAEQRRAPLITAGLLSEGEYDRCLALMEDPSFVWVGSVMIAVWGRRPRPAVGA